MSETRVRFKDRVIVDNLYENVVDVHQLKARRRNVLILLVIVIVIVALVILR